MVHPHGNGCLRGRGKGDRKEERRGRMGRRREEEGWEGRVGGVKEEEEELHFKWNTCSGCFCSPAVPSPWPSLQSSA